MRLPAGQVIFQTGHVFILPAVYISLKDSQIRLGLWEVLQGMDIFRTLYPMGM